MAGHRRERKGKGKNQEKNIRNREKQEKVRESFETYKIARLRTLN